MRFQAGQRAQRGFDGVALRVGFGAGVFGFGRHQLAALRLQADLPRQAAFAHLLFLHLDGQVGAGFGLADLALLLLDGDLGVEFVLLDAPLLLDGGIAPVVDRLVGIPQGGLARLGFQRARHLRRRLDGVDGQRQHLDPQVLLRVGRHAAPPAP